MVAESDPALYEVCTLEVPEEDGHLIQCVSTIYPGKVGDEFFMTKGHYHEERGTAEIYLCIAGRASSSWKLKMSNARCSTCSLGRHRTSRPAGLIGQ